MNIKPYELWFRALNISPIKDEHVIYPKDDLPKEQLMFARSAKDFEEWWDFVHEDFEPVEPLLARVIESKEEAARWGLWDPHLADLNEVVMVIELDAPRYLVMKEVERLLNSLKRHKRGKVAPRLAAFPLYRQPNIPMIERLLRVYELKRRKTKLWEIAKSEKLCTGPDGKPLTGECMDDHAIMQVTASRLVRKAISLVKNSHLGVFPKY